MTEEVRDVILDEGQEEETFAFQEEEKRNTHAKLKRKQASTQGRETTSAKGLTDMIKTYTKKVPSNLNMPDRNLVKARWEKTMQELKEFCDKKNNVVESTQDLVHSTVTDNMTEEQAGAMNRFEAKLLAEIEANNAKYDYYVLHFATEVSPFLPPSPQMFMQPPQQVVGGHKVFNPASETHPGYLQKDFRPTECSEWKGRFEAYLADGKMANKDLTIDIIKQVFNRLLDDHWKHRLGDKMEEVKTKEDIFKLIEKELEITHPIMKRRTDRVLQHDPEARGLLQRLLQGSGEARKRKSSV